MSSAAAQRRNQRVLVVGQLLSGLGVASGVAVGGVLAQQLAGTPAASGFVQTASTLGAGLVAVPLARLALRSGRRWALSTGFALGMVGAAVVLLAAALDQFWLMAAGMLFFGAATAAGLQARYAAVDGATPEKAGRAMSIVIWATTVGSVAGPNLSEPGRLLGARLGLVPLAGPFVFSLAAFASAALVLAVFFLGKSALAADGDGPGARAVAPPAGSPTHGAWSALRLAVRTPWARFALAGVVGGHMIMVGVMVMTPVTMNNHGDSLELIGIVISLHITGMYAASPVFGWLVDKTGPARVLLLGCAIYLVAIALGALNADSGNPVQLSFALVALGLGWSACLIGGSSLLGRSVPPQIRVPLQGATDMLMNFCAAGTAALAGPILAAGGFLWVNLAALLILVPMAGLGLRARRAGLDAPAPRVDAVETDRSARR